jgi:hypothetical protein
MRLKSWESPRSGPRRNDKSKQASARVRQLKKQTKLLRKRLKSNDDKGSARTPGTIPGVLFLAHFSINDAVIIGNSHIDNFAIEYKQLRYRG